MKYELNQDEINIVVTALRYTTECGYENTECSVDEAMTEYNEMKALIYRLNPKPVRNFAWMVVYGDGTRSHLFDWKTDAEDWAKHGRKSKVVEVIWEE